MENLKLEFKRNPNKKYIFGFLECDTLILGDYSVEGIAHTIINLIRAIGVLMLVVPQYPIWIKVLAIPLVGVHDYYNEEKKEIMFKIW